MHIIMGCSGGTKPAAAIACFAMVRQHQRYIGGPESESLRTTGVEYLLLIVDCMSQLKSCNFPV